MKAKDKKLLSYEKKFFDDYIQYLFNKTDKTIDFYSVGISVYLYKNYFDLKFGEYPGLYFGNEDFLISVNGKLFNDLYSLMINHNKKLDDVKKLQLTIDDFK